MLFLQFSQIRHLVRRSSGAPNTMPLSIEAGKCRLFHSRELAITEIERSAR